MGVLNENPNATIDNPFGHKAEYKKKFGFWSMLGVGFVITGYVFILQLL